MRNTRFEWWGFALLLALGFAASTPLYAQSADLAVSATAPATASVGSTISFIVTVQNNGSDDATSVTLTDTLPSGATFVAETQDTGLTTFSCTTPNVGDSGGTVNCTAASFPTGDAAQFTIKVLVSNSAAGTILINSASVSSETPDDNSENNTAITGTSVPGGNLADVGVTKTGPGAAPPNSDVTYTVTVSNTGPNAATNVSWTDTLPSSVPAASGPLTFVSFQQTAGPSFNCGAPGATTTCTIASLPAGVSATFDFVGHVPNTASGGTTYTNVASVSSDNDPNPDNDTSATTLTVSSADVGVTKSGPATAIAGGNFSYVITLSNGGPDAATNPSFSDTLPAGVTFVSLIQDTGPAALGCSTPAVGAGGTIYCEISLLASGQSAQFTVTVKAVSNLASGTVLTNTATATAASFDPNPNNNNSSASTTISTQADLAVSKTGPATATAGTNVTYTLTLTNNGPSDASNVTLTDTLPAGETFVSLVQSSGPTFACTTGSTVSCSRASLASGAIATFSLTVNIASTAANGTVLSNTATATTATNDATPGNNTSVVGTTVQVNTDVGIVKNGPAAVTAGSNVTYTLTLTNSGPSSASSVTLSDVLPAGENFVSLTQTSGTPFACITPVAGANGTVTCTLASFAPSSTAVFSLVVNVTASVVNGTSITNTATATTTAPDSNPANNISSTTATVANTADLAVTKTASYPGIFGSNIVYTLGVTNNGPASASAVQLVDVLPSGTQFVSITQSTGPAATCVTPAVGAGGTVTCSIPTLASGGSASFLLTVGTQGLSPSTVVNSANVTSTTIDPNPANNTASATVVLAAAAVPAPALDWRASLLLAALLGMIAVMSARRPARGR